MKVDVNEDDIKDKDNLKVKDNLKSEDNIRRKNEIKCDLSKLETQMGCSAHIPDFNPPGGAQVHSFCKY